MLRQELIACSSIDDYQNGIIKKHENTREEKELDRIRHVDTTNAQTGPIFLAYRENAVITEVVNKVKCGAPLYDFVADDDVRHAVWMISDPAEVKTIEEAFASIPNTYIGGRTSQMCIRGKSRSETETGKSKLRWNRRI